MTGFRSMLFRAVPPSLRAAITVGIGFFITIIGLKIGEITRVSVAPWATRLVGTQPDLNFAWYDIGFVNINENASARIAVLGLAFVSMFTVLRVKSAIIITICLCTFVGIKCVINACQWDQARLLRWLPALLRGPRRFSLPAEPHPPFRRLQLLHPGRRRRLPHCALMFLPAIRSSFCLCGICASAALPPRASLARACSSSSSLQDNAVTKLKSWYAFDALNRSPDISDADRKALNDAFFLPNMDVIPSGHLSFKYARKPIFWEAVWTFLFVEMFDSFGTLTGIMTRAGFMKGDPEKAMTRVNRAMCVDGLGLWLGGIIGANSITCYIESNTGVEAGARTGFASVITGAAFFLSLCFVAPFVAVIPDAATTCALVMVGVFSLEGVREINFDDICDQLAAFFCIATMGFTYSIANGICTGFIFFSWMRTVRWAAQKARAFESRRSLRVCGRRESKRHCGRPTHASRPCPLADLPQGPPGVGVRREGGLHPPAPAHAPHGARQRETLRAGQHEKPPPLCMSCQRERLARQSSSPDECRCCSHPGRVHGRPLLVPRTGPPVNSGPRRRSRWCCL